MVTRRLGWIAVAAAICGALAYLHDPPWLIDQTSGLRGWERHGTDARFRWSGAHASFFVRADAAAVEIPVSTTFDDRDARPMLVTISVDDTIAARLVLSDAAWRRVRVPLPPRGSRRVRRIDVRTSATREGNHGVRIGEIQYVTGG
jgi:hypothetical protein